MEIVEVRERKQSERALRPQICVVDTSPKLVGKEGTDQAAAQAEGATVWRFDIMYTLDGGGRCTKSCNTMSSLSR